MLEEIEIIIKSYSTGIEPSNGYCRINSCTVCKFRLSCDKLDKLVEVEVGYYLSFDESGEYLQKLKAEYPSFEELKQKYPELLL